MSLESFPNELLLLIFCYLNKFDLLYAFTNLNRRFQQLIQPYSYDIDLTHNKRPPYRLWQLFCQQILPSYRQHIRSLKLAGNQQIHLFEPYVRQLVNLKSLDINCMEEDDIDHVLNLNHFLVEALSIPSLDALSISYAEGDVFKTIAPCPA
jgi:hypothetical protein